MNHRERIIAAIDHRRVDRLPTDMWATLETLESLYHHLGVTSRIELFDTLDIDGIINVAPPYIGSPLPGAPTDPDTLKIWGIQRKAQNYTGGIYYEQFVYPLAQAETIADLEAFDWPSPDCFDYAALREQASRVKERAIECGYTAIFYYHNMLRGLELSLMDPLLRPEFTEVLIQRISDFFYEYHLRCFEAAGDIIDITQVTDDWGAQKGLLTSPRVFDEFYRVPIQRAIDLAKHYHIRVFHHDDGDMRPLLSRLVDMGIDVLNPIQWRCGNWDLQALKRSVGDQVCFHGGVDNQHTLPFDTPETVASEVRWLIDSLAEDRTGYILAPCHNIQSNTPVSNVLAMYETAHTYGQF